MNFIILKPLLQTVGPWNSNVEYFVTFKGGNGGMGGMG
jgi:hypothetical protein